MDVLTLKQKIEKGMILGANEVYIKEDNIIYGIESIYKDKESNNITLLKCMDETIKVNNFMDILRDIYSSIGNVDVFIGEYENRDSSSKTISSVEFAQCEEYKMLFINI